MAIFANAQRIIVLGDFVDNTEHNVKTVDSVVYRITYSALSVKDTTMHNDKGGYVYSKDVMRLDIGRHINKFYNYL